MRIYLVFRRVSDFKLFTLPHNDIRASRGKTVNIDFENNMFCLKLNVFLCIHTSVKLVLSHIFLIWVGFR